MYRNYEDPYKVEKLLDEAKAQLKEAQLYGADEDTLVDLHLRVEELKDRLRCAWADDEYDSMFASEEVYA